MTNSEVVGLHPNPLFVLIHGFLLSCGFGGLYAGALGISKMMAGTPVQAAALVVVVFLLVFGGVMTYSMLRVLLFTPHFVRTIPTDNVVKTWSLVGVPCTIGLENITGYSTSVHKSKFRTCEGIIFYLRSGRPIELSCGTLMGVADLKPVLSSWRVPHLGVEDSWHPLPKFKYRYSR